MSSQSRRHAKTIIDVDEYARKLAPDGSRVRLKYQEVAARIQIHRANASGALAALARIEGSGYTRIKGSNGDPRAVEYEFIMPEHYPKELEEIKRTMRLPDERGRARPRRTLTSDVIAFLYDLPECHLTARTVAEKLDARVTSVGNVLRKLREDEDFPLFSAPDIGAYTMHWIPPVKEPMTLDRPLEVTVFDRAVADTAEMNQTLLAREETSTSATPADMPKSNADAWARQHNLRMYTTSSNRLIVEGPDNKLYTLQELE
jgi:hypothetical protein